MRVAALCDIHGNLPALEAVLAEVREAAVDRIVVGGDIVPGPMSRDVLAALLALEVPTEFIFGNGEVAVLAEMAGQVPAVPANVRHLIQWEAEQLRDHQAVLAAWPLTVRLSMSPLGDVLFCHATPQNENDIFTRHTPDERLRPIFDAAHASIVVCGHTHMQFDRTIGTTRVVNAGSVGMPFGGPGAYWLLLGPGIELRHTRYDLAKAAERIRASSYPQADEFAEKYVLHPPSEKQILDAYSKAELK